MMARATANLALVLLLGAVAPSFAAEESALQFPKQDDAIVEHLPTHVGDASQRRAAIAAERAQRSQLQEHPNRARTGAEGRQRRARARPAARRSPRTRRGPGRPRALVGPCRRAARGTPRAGDRVAEPALLPGRARRTQRRSGHARRLAAGAGAGRTDTRRRAAGAGPLRRGRGRMPAPGRRRLHGTRLQRAPERHGLPGRAVQPARPRRHGRRHARTPRWRAGPEQRLDHRRRPGTGLVEPDARRARAAAGRSGRGGAVRGGAEGQLGRLHAMRVCRLAARRTSARRGAGAPEGQRGGRPRVAAHRARLQGAARHEQCVDPRCHGDAGRPLRRRAAGCCGDKSHGREQSRYELGLHGDKRAALVLAKSNWSVQHEPADEVVLAQAAHAAHRDDAAEPLWQFLRETGGRDVRLAVGGPAATAFVPPPFPDTQTVSRSGQ